MHPIDVNQSHQILGVKKDSTIKEIKQAYRSLSLQYHPDKNLEYKDGQKFKEISEAYQILKANHKIKIKTEEVIEDTTNSSTYFEKTNEASVRRLSLFDTLSSDENSNDDAIENEIVEKSEPILAPLEEKLDVIQKIEKEIHEKNE